MCKHGTTKAAKVIGNNDRLGYIEVDACIASLVDAINTHARIRTVASCCGHGHRPGNIALADGRELIIAPDFATARQIDALFPLDIHGEPLQREAAGPESATDSVEFTGYGVRRCRGHWHVTHCGEDIVMGADQFNTVQSALDVADHLNAQSSSPTPPTPEQP